MAGEQAEADRLWFHSVGAQPRDQHQVAAALAHLVAVPADHPRMYVMPSESPLPRDTFGMRGRELVVREDQVAAAALDVETGADPVERDGRTLHMPAGSARAE